MHGWGVSIVYNPHRVIPVSLWFNMKIESVSHEVDWDIYLSNDTLMVSDYWCGSIASDDLIANVCHVAVVRWLWWLLIACLVIAAMVGWVVCKRARHQPKQA
jgi:hypothetical protein